MTDDEKEKVQKLGDYILSLYPEGSIPSIFLVILKPDDDYIVHCVGCPGCFYDLIQEWAESINVQNFHMHDNQIVH